MMLVSGLDVRIVSEDGSCSVSRARPEPRLPADGIEVKVEGCPGTRANDVPRHHTSCRRDDTHPKYTRPLGAWLTAA